MMVGCTMKIVRTLNSTFLSIRLHSGSRVDGVSKKLLCVYVCVCFDVRKIEGMRNVSNHTHKCLKTRMRYSFIMIRIWYVPGTALFLSVLFSKMKRQKDHGVSHISFLSFLEKQYCKQKLKVLTSTKHPSCYWSTLEPK